MYFSTKYTPNFAWVIPSLLAREEVWRHCRKPRKLLATSCWEVFRSWKPNWSLKLNERWTISTSTWRKSRFAEASWLSNNRESLFSWFRFWKFILKTKNERNKFPSQNLSWISSSWVTDWHCCTSHRKILWFSRRHQEISYSHRGGPWLAKRGLK